MPRTTNDKIISSVPREVEITKEGEPREMNSCGRGQMQSKGVTIGIKSANARQIVDRSSNPEEWLVLNKQLGTTESCDHTGGRHDAQNNGYINNPPCLP